MVHHLLTRGASRHPRYAHDRDKADLPPQVVAELQRFFLDYKVLEKKRVEIDELRGRAQAEAVIEIAIRPYADHAGELRKSF
jgi:inorganic pyrophosphatase